MPIDFARITHRDYINKCVGYFQLSRAKEYKERQLHWLLYLAIADPKNKMSLESFWPIYGEEKRKIKMPSRKKLLELNQLFKNFGKNG